MIAQYFGEFILGPLLIAYIVVYWIYRPIHNLTQKTDEKGMDKYGKTILIVAAVLLALSIFGNYR